jgi:hypothetical protein
VKKRHNFENIGRRVKGLVGHDVGLNNEYIFQISS